MTISDLRARKKSNVEKLPAEGSDGHSFGFVTLKPPQRKKSALLVPELIGRILVISKI